MFDEKKAYNIIYMNLRSSFDIISAIDVKIFDDETIGLDNFKKLLEMNNIQEVA